MATMAGGRGRGRGRGRGGHGGHKRKLALPFKLQRELGLSAEEERREPSGPKQRRKGGSASTKDGATARDERQKRFREDNEKDERLRRSLAKKLKMKNADAKFGLDDGLNDILEGLPTTSGRQDSYSSAEESETASYSSATSSSSSDSPSSGQDESDEESSSSGTLEDGGEAAGPGASPAPVGRYVPPGLRAKTGLLDNNIARKVRGLLNRITESSVQGIACEIGAIVQNYQVQKKVIQDLICGELVRAAVEGPRASAQFAAVTASCAFGLAAQLGSSELIAKFAAVLAQKLEAALAEGEGRALHNLVLTLVHLANIRAISYSTVFSFLFHLKNSFSAPHVECIYTILRYVGAALRSSDPGTMKDFVISVHEKAGSVRSSSGGGSLSQKQEILLKSVVDIKNNRQRGNFGKSCHPLSPNVLSWFKSTGAQELCLQNLSWDSLLSRDKKGLWWLSGSDLRTTKMETEVLARASHGHHKGKQSLGPDYIKMAAEQRMNTEIRRSVFVVLMSSEDYVDAFERLVGLGLKGSQEREIPWVLLHCCIQEAAYNPYYFHIAMSLIKQSKQHKLSFIFTISDKLKELSKLNARGIVNISRLVAALVKEKLVPFTIIKALGIAGNVSKKEALFMQMLLEEYLRWSSEETIHEQLLQVYMRPEYKALQMALSMYIMKYFSKYLKNTKMDRTVLEGLKIKSQIAMKALSGNALN